MNHDLLDCLVIGAGPAGLSAAVYLRRFERQVQVLDHGHSRALAIEWSNNYPGFPHGISGHGLVQRLRDQLALLHCVPTVAEVTRLQRAPDGNFVVQWEGQSRHVRNVLLATGVQDIVPPLQGIEALQRRGLLRHCPICDGHEHRNERILVLGDGEHAANEAGFIAHYTPHLALAGLTALPALADAGVRPLPAVAARVEVSPAGGVRLWLADGQSHDFEVAYLALPVRPRSQLALALGAAADPQGCLLIDGHGATSIPGLYAAGDVAHGLDQLVVATAQGAVAATAMHNRLRHAAP